MDTLTDLAITTTTKIRAEQALWELSALTHNSLAPPLKPALKQGCDADAIGTGPELPHSIAFLFYKNTVYFSVYSKRSPNSYKISSATVQLIQGIYDLFPGNAREILRNRIYTNTLLTEMCHGMIRVAAKRATESICPVDHGISLNEEFVEIEGRFFPADFPPLDLSCGTDFMRAALQLRDRMNTHLVSSGLRPKHQSHRPIAAILVSESDEILAWAVNTHAKNKTLHAEVNLIRNFESQARSQSQADPKLPRGSKIYTTLKPCKMCAGMIWEAAEDIRTIRVYFFEDDPGPHAKNTVLDLCGSVLG